MARLRSVAPVSASFTGLPATCTSSAVAKRALLPTTPTVSPAGRLPTATSAAAITSDFQETGRIGASGVGGGGRARFGLQTTNAPSGPYLQGGVRENGDY